MSPVGTISNVAVLGFGTVGSALARRLTSVHTPRGLRLTHILDRRADAKRPLHPALGGIRWTTSIVDILESDADIVVEAIGGIDPAAVWIRGALAAGKSVVTANKQVVAREGLRLLTLAARQGRQLRFEAAVGGAMPVVRAIGDGLAGDSLTRIDAILNGTTNAVLSTMEAAGCSLESALADARARGFAEADPAADLDGSDARAKLAILCALAFGVLVRPDQIEARSTAGVTAADVGAARSEGRAIRQVAHADYDRVRSRLTAWVAPIAVDADSMFAATVGPRNAAIVTGEHSGETTMTGTGAGGDATAVAIIADLVAIARDRAAIVPPPRLATPRTIAGFSEAGAEPFDILAEVV
ncbi:MAG TPA: homoserine dehydrogenase [Vicinamibacterales bacterium]|nr:homoserine dehydrogenase [Vicinamibacterales bacterium]